MSHYKKEKSKNKRPSLQKEGTRQERIISFVIFAFAFLLYANTLNHGYVLDDDVVFLKNSFVQKGMSGMKDIFTHSFIYGFTGHNDQSYRPVVLVVYVIEKTLFGNSPHMQHFINVFLFAFLCVLIYRLAKKMFQKILLPTFFISNFEISVPFIVAILFASHPVHTEAIADIKGLDEILNFMFLAFSLLYIFRHIETGTKKYFFLSVLFFFLSLLCKEMAVTFLAIIPLTVFFFASKPPSQILKGMLPFIGAFIFYYLIRISVLDVATFEEKMKVVNNGLAAATNEPDRISTAVFMLGKYVLLLFFPHPLSWDYSFNQIPIVSFTNIKVITTLVVFAALGIFSLLKFKQKNVFAYCILFFFITMSVVSNIFIMIGSTMAERFLFTPSLAFCIAIPFFAQRFGKNILLGIVGSIVILFSFKTFTRNKDWESNFTLFASGVEATPNSSRAESALGSAYREQAEKEQDPNKRTELYKKSIGYYKKAIEILPDNTEVLYNAGVSYYEMGDRENALKVYEKALKVSPEYTNAANNAGVIYFERKDYDNAKKYFELAIKYSPNNSDALGNLGAINHNLGNLPAAIEYYKKSLQINPSNQNVQSNLARAEQALKK